MIITESFAKKFFPNEDPIGRKIKIGGGEGAARASYKTREVIGIVGDIRSSDLAKAPAPAYYVPLSQRMWGPPSFSHPHGRRFQVHRPRSEFGSALDGSGTPLYDVHTMEDLLALDLGRARFQAILLGLFAGIALLLTAVGLYGVIAYSVAQRTHEIGVRMALGASRSGVLSMILGRGLQLTGAGLVIGIAGAFALAKVIAALLFEIPPRDPATYFFVCITLSAVALLASYIPASRAARVQPTIALRYE
jgi:putative ABC transport system permease protein